MLKKILIAVFWLVFFGFFLYKLIPKTKYLSDDTLKHWGNNTTFDNSILRCIFLPVLSFIAPPYFSSPLPYAINLFHFIAKQAKSICFPPYSVLLRYM